MSLLPMDVISLNSIIGQQIHKYTDDNWQSLFLHEANTNEIKFKVGKYFTFAINGPSTELQSYIIHTFCPVK